MKKIYLLLAISLMAFSFSACSDDELNPESVIIDTPKDDWTEFDTWLDYNFRMPYNIRYIYKFEDIQSDMSNDQAPAKILYSQIMAKIIRFLWLEPYAEVGGMDFIRKTAPRVFAVYGSGNYVGTIVVTGVAEGGLKITLYGLNWLEDNTELIYNNGVDDKDGYRIKVNVDYVNSTYLKTIHHEFMHILCGQKNYPRDFNLISQDDYAAQWNSLSDEAAAKLGFVRNYASQSPGEDIAEVYCQYIGWTEEQWQAKLTQAGAEGAAKIERKLAIVKQYMKDSWGIDLERLKEVVDRRAVEIEYLNWDNFKVE